MIPMYRITRVLSVGRFASAEHAQGLRAAGVSHILNVSESPNEVRPASGFREVEWLPLEDRAPLKPLTLIRLLETLHGMTLEPDSHVYVHCVAGHLRSPTTLWLYLIACGISPLEARQWIEDRSPDAAPGSSRMVDESLVQFAQQHGLAKFRPHSRPEVLGPYPLIATGTRHAE
jgi:protein-tyrosine phosphatase